MISNGALGWAAAIAAAFAGLGVWSLAIQTAIVDVVGIIFAWQTYRWSPRLRFSGRRLRDVSGFSGTMILTQVLGLLLTRIQDVAIGRYISVAAWAKTREAVACIAERPPRPPRQMSIAFLFASDKGSIRQGGSIRINARPELRPR